MKIAVFALVLLSGCATQGPMTPFQQQMILQQMSRPAPQLQVTPMAPVNRQVTCYTNGNMTTCQ